MDADCLIKLTKAGAKSPVLSVLETSIPQAVRREAVDEGKKGNHPDAFIIEENINRGKLKSIKASRRADMGFVAHKGEREVITLFLAGGYDAVASDDARFLRKLEIAGIPAKILVRPELGGVDEDAQDDHVGLSARQLDQRYVPLVEKPHCRHQADAFARAPQSERGFLYV